MGIEISTGYPTSKFLERFNNLLELDFRGDTMSNLTMIQLCHPVSQLF
jgi:hypothetical protein